MVSPVLKVSRNDITKWMASKKMTKTPADLTPTELEQAAKELKVDKTHLMTVLASTQWDAVPVAKPVAQNRLNGDLTGGAVTYNHGRSIYDFEK